MATILDFHDISSVKIGPNFLYVFKLQIHNLINFFFVFCRYFETSASTGQGVHEMFSGVLAAVVEAKLVKAKPVINAEQSKHK